MLGTDYFQFEPDGFPEDDPGRLLGTVSIQGVPHHVVAIEVHVVEDMQVAVNPVFEEELSQWHDASGSDGHCQTVEIDDKDYVIFMSSYC